MPRPPPLDAHPTRSAPDHDAFFVPERRARGPAAQALVETARQELAGWEERNGSRKRRRRRADQDAHERMIEAIICEAVRRYLIQPDGAVAISLGKQRRTRYEPRPYAPMRQLLETLGQGALGFVDVRWGSRPATARGRTTTFAASPRLRGLARGLMLADFGRRAGGEPIVLRSTKQRVAQYGGDEVADAFELWATTGAELGDQVNYPDNPEADRLRDQMDRINAAFDKADLSLDEAALSDLPGAKLIDTGDRWLRRTFNNGHTDLRHGGRLSGGFWMDLPKAVRRRAITIGGERVVELDFRAMMPRLLYAKVGHPFPADQDPYAIPGIAPQFRDGVKKLFASLTFGPAALGRWPRGCAKLFRKGTSREAVIDLLRRHHAPIADHFGSLVGFELQRMESDILVAILLTCLNRKIIVLPIHDAVLAPVSRAQEVEAIMIDTFRTMTGAPTAVSRNTLGTP